MRKIRFGLLAIIMLAAIGLLAIQPVMGSFGQTMVKPITASSAVITQEYGDAHTGIDIYAPLDTPVYAPSTGVVKEIRTGSYRYDTGAYGAGNYVIIQHNPGDSNKYRNYCPTEEWTKYYHLNTVNVNVGNTIYAGTQIGTVGNTGNTVGVTGLHLHFELNENSRYGTFRNPREYIRFGYAPQTGGSDLW